MSAPGFDWSDLLFFLELSRRGRLVPAAKRLRADHTTVSRRIAALESALHCKLFDRNSNGFMLTDAGQKLLVYAESTGLMHIPGGFKKPMLRNSSQNTNLASCSGSARQLMPNSGEDLNQMSYVETNSRWSGAASFAMHVVKAMHSIRGIIFQIFGGGL